MGLRDCVGDGRLDGAGETPVGSAGMEARALAAFGAAGVAVPVTGADAWTVAATPGADAAEVGPAAWAVGACSVLDTVGAAVAAVAADAAAAAWLVAVALDGAADAWLSAVGLLVLPALAA